MIAPNSSRPLIKGRGTLTLISSAAGEWPPGIHWAAGESRTIPEGWPIPAERPPWLTAGSVAKFHAGTMEVPKSTMASAVGMVQDLPASLVRRT